MGRLLVNIGSHYFLEGVQLPELPGHDTSASPSTPDAVTAAGGSDLTAPPMQDIRRIAAEQNLENQQVSRASKVGFSFSHEQPF